MPVDSLVVVCCHAIWLGGPSRGQDESEWLIEPFQIGETPTFISHIKLGLDELASNDARILVFSGGDTKRSKTTTSEATSYRNLALANNLFGYPTSLISRILTDQNATDSFQNVLFPLVSFAFYATKYQKAEEVKDQSKEEPQTLPKHLTIISHEFKRRRFEELHLPAVQWPNDPERFRYIGLDPPMDAGKRFDVFKGEMLKGFGAWQTDLYGTREVLANKRKDRGWTTDKKRELESIASRGWQHSVLKEEILALFAWDGGASRQVLYPGRLPWNSLDSRLSERISKEAAGRLEGGILGLDVT